MYCTTCISSVLQLPRTCQTFKIRNGGGKEQTVYIVGTAHVSAASCDDVRAVIRAVKPEVQHSAYFVTFVELLSQRVSRC